MEKESHPWKRKNYLKNCSEDFTPAASGSNPIYANSQN